MTYEYAGFLYQVIEEADGVRMRALPGQHKNAYKQKHLMNAREQYLDERD